MPRSFIAFCNEHNSEKAVLTRCGEVERMELIPNLPDEIGLDCLARVAYKSHQNLKSVCRRWRSLINSPSFYEHRRGGGTAEQRIFILQSFTEEKPVSSHHQKIRPVGNGIASYDPVENEWERIPSIAELGNSVPLFSRCVSAKGKLIVIGGWHPLNCHPLNTVFIYDVFSATWTRGADIPTLRCFFACCVSPDGIVYVAGGHDEDKNALKTAAAYSVEKDEWEALPAMSKGRDECEAVFREGKMVVISGFDTESQWRFERSAEVYDPKIGAWKVVDNMWRRDECPRSCVVAASGQIFNFSAQGVIRYSSTHNAWSPLADKPQDVILSPSPSATPSSSHYIFVSGSEKWCYLFNTQLHKWVPIQKPPGFAGFVHSAAMLQV